MGSGGVGSRSSVRQGEYTRLMINRFRLYQQNVGTVNAVIWVAVLLYLVSGQFRYSSPVTTVIMLTAMGLCLLAPLAIMPICERYPAATAKAARLLQYAILVFILLTILNVFTAPGWVFMLVILLVFFYFGWTFWFFSSPAVFTNRRAQVLREQQLAYEEAVLEHEIEQNQRELDELDGHDRP